MRWAHICHTVQVERSRIMRWAYICHTVQVERSITMRWDYIWHTGGKVKDHEVGLPCNTGRTLKDHGVGLHLAYRWKGNSVRCNAYSIPLAKEFTSMLIFLLQESASTPITRLLESSAFCTTYCLAARVRCPTSRVHYFPASEI